MRGVSHLVSPDCPIQHNAFMLSPKAVRRSRTAILNLLVLLCCMVVPPLVPASPVPAGSPPKPSLDLGYLPALAAVDRFLQAWQSGDPEQGMVLLTRRAKESSGSDAIEKFFSHPETSAYQIDAGKRLQRGRYEFPVVLVTGASAKARVRRRFCSIVVVNTGGNDWAVDKLP